MTKKFRVTCMNCKSNDLVTINEADRAVMWGHVDRIISARYRLDNSWGFQCICGQNSLMTKQEKDQITNYQNPDPKEISEILKNLIPEKRQYFKMEPV